MPKFIMVFIIGVLVLFSGVTYYIMGVIIRTSWQQDNQQHSYYKNYICSVDVSELKHSGKMPYRAITITPHSAFVPLIAEIESPIHYRRFIVNNINSVAYLHIFCESKQIINFDVEFRICDDKNNIIKRSFEYPKDFKFLR